MRLTGLLLSSSMIVAFCGCGGSGPSSGGTVPTQPSAPALNGNWEMKAMSQVSRTTYLVGGSLSTSGTAVSGILHILNNGSCEFDWRDL